MDNALDRGFPGPFRLSFRLFLILSVVFGPVFIFFLQDAFQVEVIGKSIHIHDVGVFGNGHGSAQADAAPVPAYHGVFYVYPVLGGLNGCILDSSGHAQVCGKLEACDSELSLGGGFPGVIQVETAFELPLHGTGKKLIFGKELVGGLVAERTGKIEIESFSFNFKAITASESASLICRFSMDSSWGVHSRLIVIFGPDGRTMSPSKEVFPSLSQTNREELRVRLENALSDFGNRSTRLFFYSRPGPVVR